MKKCFLDKVLTCLGSIFKVRLQHELKGKDTPDEKLLSDIPIIDITFFNKVKESIKNKNELIKCIEELLPSYSFSKDIIDNLENAANNGFSDTDASACILVIQTILWSVNPEQEKNDNMFQLITLYRAIQCTTQQVLLCTGFSIMMEVALRGTKINFNEVLYKMAFAHYLDPFAQIKEATDMLAPLFGSAIRSGLEIEQLVMAVAKELHSAGLIEPDIAEVISNYIKPFAVSHDEEAIVLFATFAQYFEDSIAIKEIFRALLDQLVSKIICDPNDIVTESAPIQNLKQKNTNQSKYEFDPNYQMIFGKYLTDPDVSIIHSDKTIEDYIDKDLKDDIDMLATILADALPSHQYAFYFSFIEEIGKYNMHQNFINLCLVFIILYKGYSNDKLLGQGIALICRSIMFQPNQTIFNEEKVPENILFARKCFFDLLESKNTSNLMTILQLFIEEPYLFIESLLHILAREEKFNWSDFVLHDCMCLLVHVFNYINGRESNPNIINIFITFIFKLIDNQRDREKILSDPKFTAFVFQTMFQYNIHPFVLDCIFEKLLYITNNNSKLDHMYMQLQSILNSCKDHKDDQRYFFIASDIIKHLDQLFKENGTAQSENLNIYNSVLEYTIEVGDESLIDKCVSMLSSAVDNIIDFDLDGRTLKNYINLFKKYYPDEIPQKYISAFHRMIGAEYCDDFNTDPIFIMKSSSVFPLILGVVGKTKQLGYFLKLMHITGSKSQSNVMLMHHGFVDYIIAKTINSGGHLDLIFKGAHIEIEADEQLMIRYIIPLLKTFTDVVCDYSIIYMLAKTISGPTSAMTNDLLRLFLTIIAHSSKVSSPEIEAFDNQPGAIITGISWTDLQYEFAFSFNLNYDFLLTNETKCIVNLFKMFDEYGNTLQVDLKESSIYLQYTYNDFLTKVQITRAMHYMHINKLIIQLSVNSENLLIARTFLNSKHMTDTELNGVFFEDTNLTFQICSITQMNDSKPTSRMATVSDFCIYSGNVVNNDLTLNPKNATLVCSTKNAGQNATITNVIQGKGIFAQSKVINAQIIPKLYQPTPVLQSIITPSISSIIIDFIACFNKRSSEYLAMFFDIIRYSFDASVEFQRDFPYVGKIATNMLGLSSSINRDVYDSVIACLSVIRDDKLMESWIDSLVLNLFVWSLANSDTLYYIIKQWTRLIFCNYNQFLTSNEMFNKVLDRFCIFFSFTDDSFHQEFKSFDRHFDASVLPCRSEYLKLLRKIASTYFSEENSVVFFNYLAVLKSDQTIEDFLTVLLDIGIGNYSMEKISILHYLIGRSDAITRLVILIIHNTSNEYVHSQILTCIEELVPSESLFETFFDDLEKYPNLYQVLCKLAIKLGPDYCKRLGQRLMNFTESKPIINTGPCWYFLLVSFAIEAEAYTSIDVCHFIAYALKQTQFYKTELLKIIHLISILNPSKRQVVSQILQSSIVLSLEQHRSEIAEVCFYQSFFTFKPPSHNAALVQLFSQSVFSSDGFTPGVLAHKLSFSNIDEFEAFSSLNFNKMELNFSVDVDLKGAWPDLYRAQMLKDEIMGNDQMRQVFQYFLSKFLTKSTEAKREPLEIAQLFTPEATALFRESLKTVSADINFIIEIRKEVASSFKGSYNSTITQRVMNELMATSTSMTLSHFNSGMVTRDPTICSCCIYPKLRQQPVKLHYKKHINTDNLISLPASLITIGDLIQVFVKIGQDFIVIETDENQKVVLGEQVQSYISTAPLRCEIFTTKSQSFLLRIEASDASPLFRFLQKYGQCIAQSPEKYTSKWLNGEITTFEYIVKLNLISGRSFKELDFYPIFPTILSDFENYSAGSDIAQRTILDNNMFYRASEYPSNDTMSLESIVTGKCLIPPEFYFLPSAIIEGDKLPPFAEDSFDFIAKHRKLLETQTVTYQIPAWIDSVFGINSNFKHRKLFLEPHPQRVFAKKPSGKMSRMSIKGIDKIEAGWLRINNGDISVCAITGDGKVLSGNVSTKTTTMKLNQIADNVFVDPNSHTCLFKDTFYVVSGSEIVSISDTVRRYPTPMQSNSVGTLSHRILFCRNRCTIVDTEGHAFCHSVSPVSIFATNHSFNLLVYATVDGTIGFVDSRGHLRAEQHIESDTNGIAIGETLGNVLVCTDDTLYLFGVNGEEIKREKLSYRIVSIFSFSDSGSDYVIFEDAFHRIGFFEMTNLSSPTFFYESKGAVVGVGYDSAMGQFALLTQLGQIRIVIHEVNTVL